MLNIKEIDKKRLKYGISRYKLCKDSTINTSHYYKLLKNGNPTEKTLGKLNTSLTRIIEKPNGRNNGHK